MDYESLVNKVNALEAKINALLFIINETNTKIILEEDEKEVRVILPRSGARSFKKEIEAERKL